MTSTPPLAPPETGKPHPWSCPACTFRNKATDKQCEVCKHARPAQRPNSAALGLLFQVHDSHHRTPEFEQPFGLEGLTVTTTLGFLRDLIEAKTGIADRHQKLVFRGVELTASAETLLVDALDDLKPFDVISVLRVEDEPSNDDAGWGDDMDAEQTPQRETSEDPFESAQTGDDGWGQDNADSGWGTVTADDGQWQPEDKMDESGGADDEEKTDESDDFSSRAFYNLLTATELEELCHVEVKELSELMGTSADDTGTLLRHFSWAKVQLTEMFVNNPKKVLDSLGPLGEETSTSPSTLFDCPLCADSQIPLYETTALRCAHRYCNTCWKGWITAAFDNGKTMISTNCPAVKCKVIVPASVMKKFLEPAQGHKLDEWYLENFVQNRKDLKWCPFPGCSRAAQALSPNAVVACSCDFTWCFSCQQPDHRPLTCQLAETWNQKNSSDSENVTWIMANTKKCPNCQVSIEKNQGCNHMTCRRCKHEFCWLCKADWKGHSSCAQFQGNDNNKKAKEAHSEQKEIEKAKDELNRYMHYFERYNNHFNAIKHAKAIREKTQLRMEEMQKLKGTGSRDVKYLLDAVNAVISCHHTLQWTYAYGYYLDRKSKTKDLFESNQTSLEQFTDSLHEMTEQPLENLIEGKEKINIVSYTRLVQKFRRNVISAIRSGYQH